MITRTRLSDVLHSSQDRSNGIIEYALVLPSGAMSQLSYDYDTMLRRAKAAWPGLHDDVTPKPSHAMPES